ncbi:biotin/lipoyl-binding protein [Candidatus Villigracilis proximus]|uniref:biotin/lipoyl-binding protein n=1 Tax=Candidatus Villigracilis proximus TaxID=3140683 RepID=UPI0031ECA8AE
MHSKIPMPVRIVLAVILIGALAYVGYRTLNDSTNGDLTASGSIEATIVNVSPELAGKVSAVDVEEGSLVAMNDSLLHLDPSLLTAQRAVAAVQVDSANAALASAQTKYDQTLQAALSAQEACVPKIGIVPRPMNLISPYGTSHRPKKSPPHKPKWTPPKLRLMIHS